MKTKKILCLGIIMTVLFPMISTKTAFSLPKQDQKGHSIFQETMADMTWQEVEKAAAEGAVILTNTSVIEEHGPHMDCGIDAYLGYQM
ncbi:MAG: creatininase family protein, partial [Candidatus Aminicenantes bacterium]|nr:creatininase family protein [Candidatus Aminicenantes bacterium]